MGVWGCRGLGWIAFCCLFAPKLQRPLLCIYSSHWFCTHSLFKLEQEDRLVRPKPPKQILEQNTSGPGSWQIDSLAESWASDMEPEVQNLDTSEFSEDQSENHSSTSDIIHLEAYPYGRMESDEEEDADLQSSMMSILDSEKGLAEMRAEIGAESDLRPPETEEILMCVEDPIVEEIELEDASEQIFSHIPLLSEHSNFALASVPIPEIISQVLEHLPSWQELPQTPSSTLTLSEEAHTFESESSNAPASSLEGVVQNADTSGAPNTSFFEIPVLLVGGAALMAVMGVLTYTLNRK